MAPEATELRLNKYLALHAGVSRREADRLIAAGRVELNGQRVELLATQVTPQDRVVLDGKVLEEPRELAYVIYNKPEDALVTRSDPQGRRTIYQLLPPQYHHLQPVGRLDRDSCGLLLLTNDGELSQRLMHPRYKVAKTYHVKVNQSVSEAQLEALNGPVSFREIHYQAAQVEPLQRFGARGLKFLLKEGKKRQIRRMCKSNGLHVVYLQRVALGSIQLGKLKENQCRALTPREAQTLLELCDLQASRVS